MSTCEINGIPLYYEDTSVGRPALFIHGMCGNANVWDDQVARLSGKFRCITYDRRGHARTPLGTIEGRTVELHADDAAGLIKALGVEPCVLVASSGGARIGVDLLRRYPELFTAGVLSEPPIFGLDPQHGGAGIMQTLQPTMQAAIQTGGTRAAVDAFFDYMCPGLWATLSEEGKEPYRANDGELLPDLQMPQYAISEDDLRKMTTRCLMVTGSVSNPVLRRVTRFIAESMPNAELVEFAGVGHVTYAEAPAEFADVVLSLA
jgi:3-oxoadipate enol-lactonase